jgi:hypothetical protein
VIGMSTRLPADDAYPRFIDMVGEAAGKALGDARTFETDLRQKEEAAAIDQAMTVFFSNVSQLAKRFRVGSCWRGPPPRSSWARPAAWPRSNATA